MEIPEKYIRKIELNVQYCECCQPRDNEEPEGFFWVLGDRICFHEYLSEIKVPEKYFEEIDNKFNCPNCGCTIGLYTDVGLKTKFEIEYEKKYDKIISKLAPDIEEFSYYLEKYPYLGLNHRIGKKIKKEISNIPKTTIKNEIWYRARAVNSSKKFTYSDMMPPNPEMVTIGEGRFNHYGQSVYYLGDEKRLCALEVSNQLETICWIQKLEIISLNNILDLSVYINPDNIDYIPFVFAGIIITGEINKKVIRDKNWKPEYFVSRFISDICREANIDGIKYNSTVAIGNNLAILNMDNFNYKLIRNPYIYKLTKEKSNYEF